MRVAHSGACHAAFLVVLLVIQVTAMGISPSENLGAKMNPMLTNETLTDNGDGTWNVTYAVDLDATLDSRASRSWMGFQSTGYTKQFAGLRFEFCGFSS